uniref:Golgi associated RAB2 interactor protein-like Rab2B-binding domain-containing protein n=1 Tax=Varanus komodoensis TaxID=61221 RepID=A0A8D2LYL8_VARKO
EKNSNCVCTRHTELATCILIMGDLQKVLERGEYIPLRSAPVFESNFVQVNRRGESIYLHNRPNYVTMGLCASSPSLSLPNVMLLAQATPSSSQTDLSTRPACRGRAPKGLSQELTWKMSCRFLPLKFVDLSVHSAKKRRIKLKLVSGRAYYLELCAAPQKQAQLFRQWMRIINLLKSKSKGSSARARYKDLGTQEESRAIRNKALNVSASQKHPTHLHQSEIFDHLQLVLHIHGV